MTYNLLDSSKLLNGAINYLRAIDSSKLTNHSWSIKKYSKFKNKNPILPIML